MKEDHHMPAPRTNRRHLLVIGAAFPLSTLVAHSAIAHNGHDHGASSSPVASPDASPSASPVANTGTGAAYLTIVNHGSTPDTLRSGRTDAAQSVELHSMSIDGGVMSMKEMPEGAEIPAGGTVVFEPQGAHIMLVNLNHNLNPGSTYELTLSFSKAGDVIVTIHVQVDPPEDTTPVKAGDLTIDGAWSRPAPRITA